MVNLITFKHKLSIYALTLIITLISIGMGYPPAKAVGEPNFSIQYYSDSDLTVEASPALKAGTYYLKITSDEDLSGAPTINIDAEGTLNDVTDGATLSILGSTTTFQYTRVIIADEAAIGEVREDISITGTDTEEPSNTATNASPTNEDSHAAYTDTKVPDNENSVFPGAVFDHGGHAVAINSSGNAANSVWLAPLGTTTFIAGNTMTLASGVATSILAPANAGVYYLYIIDEAGNISENSTAALTVDNTTPTGSMQIKTNRGYAKRGRVILRNSVIDAGGSGIYQMRFSNNNSVWSTWQNYYSSKAWSMTSGHGATTAQGTKRVYAQFSDYAGNIFSCSDTVKYDKTPPTGTIKINNGDQKTRRPSVTLSISGSDTGGAGVRYMRLSNNKTKWTSWRAYSTRVYRWNLTSSTYGGSKRIGTKRVYIQFKDRAGNISDTVSDRISYRGLKYIIIDLSRQRLYAYENNSVVISFLISSGTSIHPTPKGNFQIFAKTRSQLMDGPDYYLPNVQWISWFRSGGYSIHGTYWHHNFGHPMSHGCVNATNHAAKWIYQWAPIGTSVTVRS